MTTALPARPIRWYQQLLRSAGIALLLMLFCWLWLQVDFTFDSEAFQVKTSSLIKEAFSDKDSNYTDEFVFIDISGNKQLVPRADGSGDDLITDRAKLDTFFQLINKRPNYRYILCDIYFENALPRDSTFGDLLAATPRLIIPKNQTEDGIQPAAFTDVEQGLTSYSISSGYHSSDNLVKYTLQRSPTAKSIPLMMHERLTGLQHASMLGLLWQKERVGFNHFIPSYRMQPRHMTEDSLSKIRPLNYMLLTMRYPDTTLYDQLFRNKYIVIGDFLTDSHPTVLGPMPGPLLQANIYLSLREGDNIITGEWLLYVFIAFTILALLLFYPPGFYRRIEEKLIGSPGGILFAAEEWVLSVLLLWVLSLVSYLWFHRHLDVVMPATFISLFAIVVKIRDHQKKKSTPPKNDQQDEPTPGQPAVPKPAN